MENEKPRSALRVLSRLAKRRLEARAWLKAALHGRIGFLGEAAFETAIGTGGPIGDLLADEVEGATEQVASELLLLSGQENYNNSLHLLEVRRNILEKRLASLRGSAATETNTSVKAKLAQTAIDLGISLGRAGQPERGLLLAYDALELLLDLSESDESFRLPVVSCLYNVGVFHSRLGPREDALWYYSQAADLWRLLEPRRRDRPLLASILTSWATCIAEEDENKEADGLLHEAIRIWRALPTRNNHQLGRLAVALAELSDIHADAGDFDEAFRTSQEGSAISQELAAERPDVFLAQHAFSLGQLGARLDDLGRTEEGLAYLAREETILRSLMEYNSDSFAGILAGSLSLKALFLESLDRPKEALEACRESVRLKQAVLIVHTELTAEDFVDELLSLEDLLSSLGHPLDEIVEIEEETLLLVLPAALEHPTEMHLALTHLKQEYLELSERCRRCPNPEILRQTHEVESRAHARSATALPSCDMLSKE